MTPAPRTVCETEAKTTRRCYKVGGLKKKKKTLGADAAEPSGSGLRRRGRCRKVRRRRKGGFLPLLPLIGALGALGSVAGGASAIANAVNNAKAAKKRLEEMVRHNKAMEGKGMKGRRRRCKKKTTKNRY